MFLDRDGVLVEDEDLLTPEANIALLPGAADAIRRLRAAGFSAIVVTNQPNVARGLVTEEHVDRIHARIVRLLEKEGAAIDRFYFCPHHPAATLPKYRSDCACRKPLPGMLLAAARELGVELSTSILVGDRPSDIAAGHRAGCRTILVTTGQHMAPPIESAHHPAQPVVPDRICADLAEAATRILSDAEWNA